MVGVVKIKHLILWVVVACVLVGAGVGSIVVRKTNVPKQTYTIVIDAGHGGRDNGCSGNGGSIESEINLAIAKKTQKFLTSIGINVVMTRVDNNGLYDAGADNFKQSDMAKRMEIIESANPDMVISIHQNSFKDTSQHGAQAFYQQDDERSQEFAIAMQNQLKRQLIGSRMESNKGDYYLLKESKLPAILIECGYLTNVEDELRLMSDDYQDKVAYAILCGVVEYFGLCGDD